MLTETDMINGATEQRTEEILAFLMVGQSNMAGRGDIGEVEPIDNPECLMFRMGMWQPMTEPINIDKSANAGFVPGIGLAASFADSLQKQTGRKIGLIPCAQGGSTIEQWQPGEALYDNAVFTAKLALRNAKFGGILWHQGESNCKNCDMGDYREKFMNTMCNMRREFDALDLPLIVGEISESIGESWELGDWTRKFNLLLKELAIQQPCCAVASQEGLSLRPDGIHFDAKSCRVFGKRYFEQYITLVSSL